MQLFPAGTVRGLDLRDRLRMQSVPERTSDRIQVVDGCAFPPAHGHTEKRNFPGRAAKLLPVRQNTLPI